MTTWNEIELFEVGGCVRDELLGLPVHDVDYTVVAKSFDAMHNWLVGLGFDIFVTTPETLTIRARFPEGIESFAGRVVEHLTADFVLARKEGAYFDGRHPELVTPGTLEDDLRRRDFTVNAMAKTADGSIIDLFGGLVDLEQGILRAVGNAEQRIREDGLRALRAVRFAVTKGLAIDGELWDTLASKEIAQLLRGVSVDRKRQELTKCFAHNTKLTLALIGQLGYGFMDAVFTDGLWLLPTTKEV